MIILKGEDVFTQLKFAVKGTYKSGPNEGKPYFVMAHGKRGFTLDEEAFSAWKSGNMASISLEESSYEREDPENEGSTITVDSLTYSGHLSNDQQFAVASQVAKIKEIEMAVTAKYAKLNPKSLAETI